MNDLKDAKGLRTRFKYWYLIWLLLKPGPGPWTRILKNLDPEKPGSWKTWNLKNLDPEKPGSWKTWTLKNMDPENLDYEKSGPRKTWRLKNVNPEIHESWKTWNKYGIKKYVWLERVWEREKESWEFVWKSFIKDIIM